MEITDPLISSPVLYKRNKGVLWFIAESHLVGIFVTYLIMHEFPIINQQDFLSRKGTILWYIDTAQFVSKILSFIPVVSI